MGRDILELIKNRRTIRRYKDKPVPKKIIDKILEAGIWGPSLLAPGFQPWRFLVITNKPLIKKISEIMFNQAPKVGAGGNIVLRMSAATIASCNVLIVIYNNHCVSNFLKRFRNIYIRIGKGAELSAISAAIQNMILVAESHKVGSCWLDAAKFCENKINKLLKKENEIVAMLSLGYAAHEGRRCRRLPKLNIVEVIK